MKKIARILPILLSVLLFISVIFSCGNGDDDYGVYDDDGSDGYGGGDDDDDNFDDDMFTDRDLEQTPDLSEAEYIVLSSGEDVSITEEGIYVISGSATNVTVVVDADDEAKVQLVLDGVSVTNEDSPVVYVKSADKVFVTTTDGDNTMKVSGTYEADGDTNLDAVIFCKEDLTLNGTGSLEIVSTEGNGVTSKDDLKITGGSLTITSALDSLEANDSIRIGGGELTIDSGKDALHSEYDEDDSVGFIYIAGGTLNISAADDGIRGTTYIQIDGGIVDVSTSTEGIEATYIQINNGNIDVYATDDGINATEKSSAYSLMIEVNGGTIYVQVGPGDTDGFDSNGDIYINGGTTDVIAPFSAFDCNGNAAINGGTVRVNGQVIHEITCEGGPPPH